MTFELITYDSTKELLRIQLRASEVYSYDHSKVQFFYLCSVIRARRVCGQVLLFIKRRLPGVDPAREKALLRRISFLEGQFAGISLALKLIKEGI